MLDSLVDQQMTPHLVEDVALFSANSAIAKPHQGVYTNGKKEATIVEENHRQNESR